MHLSINVLALLVVEYLVPGFELSGFQAAIVAAIVIGMVNTLIRPILQIIALPITIMSFGIFAFLINVVLLWVVSKFITGFEIVNFTTAIVASIVLSLVSWFLHRLAKD